MAFRITIASREKLFQQLRNRRKPNKSAFRCAIATPSSSPTHLDDSDREDSRADPILRRPQTRDHSRNRIFDDHFRNRIFGTGWGIFSAVARPGYAFGDRRFAIPAYRGLILGRNFCSDGSFEEGATDILTDTSGILAMKYLIEYIHVYTRFDWWASIAFPALLIRSLQLPLVLNQPKYITTTTVINDGYSIPKWKLRSALLRGATFSICGFIVFSTSPSWKTSLHSTYMEQRHFGVSKGSKANDKDMTCQFNGQESMDINSTAGATKTACKAFAFAALTIPFPKKCSTPCLKSSSLA